MATDVAMNDMDIDFDMDAEVDPEIARLQAEAAAINASADAANADSMNGVEEVREDGEIDSSAAQPTKVHVRGVDKLNTFDIEVWAGEYYSMDNFRKVQWIDDTSANLIYGSEIVATEALQALSAEQVTEPLQSRQAKRSKTHPDAELQIRQAIVADVKAPGAKDRSAFYLFNKEWDPDNPDNIRPSYRKRRWADEDNRDRKYRRREYGRDQYQRRDSGDRGNFHEGMYDDEPKGRGSGERGNFHEGMYDDEPKIETSVRRGSVSSGNEYASRKRKANEDLFAGREKGRLRNRSASPTREGDGRYGFADDQPYRRTARARSRTPPGVRQGRDNRGAGDDTRVELFPDRKGSSALTNGHAHKASVDSFSSRPSTSNSVKELFPDKVNGTWHRRRAARHEHPDEIADAIDKYTLDGMSERCTYSRSGRRPDNRPRKDDGGGKDLFSRIIGGPEVESSYGRLQDRPPIERRDAGFSIKGAGSAKKDDDFSILGASRERVQNPLVKELFPLKAGGQKELFDGRIKGRAQRNRAEDLF